MVTYMMNNPILPIVTIKNTDGTTANTVGVNIGLLQESFYVTFTFGDGPGSFNFTASGTTNFEKLVYMSYQRGTGLTLTLNGTTTGGIIGTQITYIALSTTVWYINGDVGASGTLATPIS